MFGLSPEQTKYQFSNKCPRCGRFVLPPFAMLRFKTRDGFPISVVTPFPLMDKSAVAQCPKCGQEWPVFGSEHAPELPTPVSAVDVVETDRLEEPYYEDERILDNRGGESTATQTISVTEQWTQTIQFEREHTRTTGGSGGINVAEIVSIEAKAESTLRSNYSINDTRQRTYTGELSVEVPPHTLRRLTLRFRRIWQNGFVRVPLQAGGHAEIPFRVALNLSLDWSQEDQGAPST